MQVLQSNLLQKSILFIKKHEKVFLLFLSAVLYAMDNAFSGWFVFLPVLLLARKCSLKNAWLYGGLCGVLSVFLYATWLVSYSPFCMLMVFILYFIQYASLFEVLILIQKYGKKYSPVLLTLALVGFEYLKTKGFAGFSYGISGYTQYKNPLLIQISDFSGVFGVCFLLDFFSVVLYEAFCALSEKRFSFKNIFLIIVFHIFLSFTLIYGFFRIYSVEKRDSVLPKASVTLIQHNPDMKKTGFENYRKDCETLMALTSKAISSKESALYVWPETAVVPSILQNYENYEKPERMELSRNILNFIEDNKINLLTGNFYQETEKKSEGELGKAFSSTKDYNAALLFEAEKNTLPPEPFVYRKMHLVPFSETLPFDLKLKEGGKLSEWMKQNLWEKGKEPRVFELDVKGGTLKFSTPICFEDMFGSDLRVFYKNGARCFISISNDAWAQSRRCQNQHLKIAAFRAVENHVPLLRCSASGETCLISSTGKITSRAPSFKECYLNCEIPILK